MIRKAGMVLLAALALGACGGEDEGGGALGKTELAAAANKICKASQEKAADVEAPSNIQDPVAAAKYFNAVAPIIQSEVDQLSELEPDGAVEDDWKAFLKAETEANELIQTVTRKANEKDPSGLEDLGQLQELTTRINDTATAVGADTCRG